MLSKTVRWVIAVVLTVVLMPLLSAEPAHGQNRGRQGRQNGGQPPTQGRQNAGQPPGQGGQNAGQPPCQGRQNGGQTQKSGSKSAVVRGTITAISGSTVPGTVTITPQNGPAVTVNVTANTKITRNRQTATLADLQKNDKATAVYDASNNALVLHAHIQTSVVRGTITAISGTTTGTVTITPANGTAVTVNITTSTKITRNGQTATLADLQKKDKASATYDSSNNALRLEARTPVFSVRGTITAISGNAVPATVTITPSSGAAVTLNITASTKIIRNGQTATLADLQQNDKARAVYDSRNNALTLAARGS
jgi:hypothetical protein